MTTAPIDIIAWRKLPDRLDAMRLRAFTPENPVWRVQRDSLDIEAASAITTLLDALESANERIRELEGALADPNAVHVNMLRGTLAKPSLAQIEHIYPEIAQTRLALLEHVEAFRPFTNRPVGGEGSPARREQERQIAVHARALSTLSRKDTPDV